MVMFKTAAAEQLRLLWIMSMMANTFRMLPSNPATKCGAEVYQRVILTLDFLALAAAVLLLAVRMAVSAAESNAVTALRMAVIIAESKTVAAMHVHARAKAYDARHEAAAAAVEGVASVVAKWRRVSLRGTLLLAVVLSAASCLLAVVAMEDWFVYWSGCDAGYGVGSPLSVFLMVVMVWYSCTGPSRGSLCPRTRCDDGEFNQQSC